MRCYDMAQKHSITVNKFITQDAKAVSDQLSEYFFCNPHDLIVAFYTKLFQAIYRSTQWKVASMSPGHPPLLV